MTADVAEAFRDAGVLNGRWDPLQESADLGFEQYESVGALAFPVLEASSIVASFQEGTYSDSRARLRMHVYLNWKAGYYKSSILEVFMQRCLPSVDMLDQPDEYDVRELSYLDATSFTVPFLRGSMNNGIPVYPMIQRPKFVLASEFMTLLGSSPDEQKEMMRFLNKCLEEGRAVHGLVKQVSTTLKPEHRAEFERRGIKFNERNGVMSFETNFTMWAASCELEASEEKVLRRSGLWDRMHRIAWLPSDEEYLRQWRHRPRVIGQDRFDRLKDWNRRLWSAEWNQIRAPPDDLFEPAKRELDRVYTELERDYKRTPRSGMRSARDNTNLNHLFTIVGTIQTMQGDGKPPFDDVRYDRETLERVKAMLPLYVRARCPWE